jgi:hypothetical protein
MLFAGAVDTGVLGAGGAGSQELFAQGCAGAMETDRCGGCGEAVLPSEVAHALLAEVNGTESLGVLRLETVEDGVKTRAHLAPEIGLSRCLQLTRQLAC